MIAGLGAAAILLATFVAVHDPWPWDDRHIRDLVAGLLLVFGLCAIGANLALVYRPGGPAQETAVRSTMPPSR